MFCLTKKIQLCALAAVILGGANLRAETCTVKCSRNGSFVISQLNEEDASMGYNRLQDFESQCRSYGASTQVTIQICGLHYNGPRDRAYICTKPKTVTATGYGRGTVYEARQQARTDCLDSLIQEETPPANCNPGSYNFYGSNTTFEEANCF